MCSQNLAIVCMHVHLSPPPKITKFGKTSEMLEGFCFVISLTDLKRPNIEKDEDYLQIPKDMKFELFLFLCLFLFKYSAFMMFTDFIWLW
jgi:hypothetical protein